MIISLETALEKIEALESTIKFLKEEIETYKLGVSGCKSVLEENRKLKEMLDGAIQEE